MTITIHIGKLRLTRELPVRRESAAVVCAACGAENDTRNFYCGNCGKPLGRP